MIKKVIDLNGKTKDKVYTISFSIIYANGYTIKGIGNSIIGNNNCIEGYFNIIDGIDNNIFGKFNFPKALQA